MQKMLCRYIMLSLAFLSFAPKAESMNYFWNIVKGLPIGASSNSQENQSDYLSLSKSEKSKLNQKKNIQNSKLKKNLNNSENDNSSSSEWEEEIGYDGDLEIDLDFPFFRLEEIKQPAWNPKPTEEANIGEDTIYTFKLIGVDENDAEQEFIIEEKLLTYSSYLEKMASSGMVESQYKTIYLRHLSEGSLYQMWEIASVYHLLSAADSLANAVAAGADKNELIAQILQSLYSMPEENHKYILHIIEELQIESLTFIALPLALNTLQSSEGILTLRNENKLAYINHMINNSYDDNLSNFIHSLINNNLEFFYSILPSYKREAFRDNLNFYDPEVNRPNKHIVAQNINTKDVKLYNTKTKLQFRTLSHDAEVFNNFFDSSGTKFITAAKDSKARVWDVKSGNILHTFNIGCIYNESKCIALSPCGRFLALLETGDNLDQTIKLYNFESGVAIKELMISQLFEKYKKIDFSYQDELIIARAGYHTSHSFSYKLPHIDKNNLSHLFYLLLLKEMQNNNAPVERSDALTDIHISLPKDLKEKVNSQFAGILYQLINNLKE